VVGIPLSVDSALGFPAIDSTGLGGRFTSTVCPFGLLGMSTKVMQASMPVKGKRFADKKTWAISVENNAEADRAVGSRHVDKLKKATNGSPPNEAGRTAPLRYATLSTR
jgi:hypothetical protein